MSASPAPDEVEPRWLRVVARVDRVLERGEGAVISLAVLGMAAIGIANVVGRDAFGRSLASAQELNAILVITVTFLGIGRGAREGRHIRMSALHDQLRGRARKVSMVLSHVLTCAVLATFAAFAVRYAASVASVGSVTPALRIPRAWLVAAAPLGLALGAVQYALAALRNLADERVHLSLVREDRHEPVETAAGPPDAPC